VNVSCHDLLLFVTRLQCEAYSEAVLPLPAQYILHGLVGSGPRMQIACRLIVNIASDQSVSRACSVRTPSGICPSASSAACWSPRSCMWPPLG